MVLLLNLLIYQSIYVSLNTLSYRALFTVLDVNALSVITQRNS